MCGSLTVFLPSAGPFALGQLCMEDGRPGQRTFFRYLRHLRSSSNLLVNALPVGQFPALWTPLPFHLSEVPLSFVFTPVTELSSFSKAGQGFLTPELLLEPSLPASDPITRRRFISEQVQVPFFPEILLPRSSTQFSPERTSSSFPRLRITPRLFLVIYLPHVVLAGLAFRKSTDSLLRRHFLQTPLCLTMMKMHHSFPQSRAATAP